MESASVRVVAVFGTFDGLHPGHISFLRQARTCGDYLVVSVARDAFVRGFKGRAPRLTEEQRMEGLRQSGLVDEVRLSDPATGTYRFLREVRPAVICLGYDQQELADDLHRWLKREKMEIPVHRLQPYRGRTYKSSLLRSRA